MGLIVDVDEVVWILNQIGYLVMIKVSVGGGGKGMCIVWIDQEVCEGFQFLKNEVVVSFGDDRIFIEKFVIQLCYIEIQVLVDSYGNCVYLYECECLIQCCNQKVIEEVFLLFLDLVMCKVMGKQVCVLVKVVGYISVGMVEFIVDGVCNFYFFEMNIWLQVEYLVIELIIGVDLVEQMICVVDGQVLFFV